MRTICLISWMAFLAGCTTTWLIRGKADVSEVTAKDTQEVVSFTPVENDLYISISARYVAPQKSDKAVDLTELACKKSTIVKKIKQQTAIIYAYIDQQELPIPIFGVSTVEKGDTANCFKKMDEVLFLPRLLLESDGLTVKIDLRHDNKDDISNEDVQDILSKVVTFASLASNGTLSIIPAARLALERLNPDMSVNFNRENYVATNSFHVTWNDRVTKAREYRLPLYYYLDEKELLDAGYVEFKVMPRVTRFKNIPLYAGRGTPNYENRYLEDLGDMSGDRETMSALKIMVLEFRRDVANVVKPAAINERCRRFVTELNRYDLNNYDGAFLLYLAMKGVRGFNQRPELTNLECANRYRTAIRNSFPYWRGSDEFRVQKEEKERVVFSDMVARATFNRLAAALTLPEDERLAFFKTVFSEEVQVENRGDFPTLKAAGMSATPTLVKTEDLVKLLQPLQSAGLGCYFDLSAGKRRIYIEDYAYLALYRDKDPQNGAQGFMRLLANVGRTDDDRYRITALGFDRVLPADPEHFTKWCAGGCSPKCNAFRAPLDSLFP